MAAFPLCDTEAMQSPLQTPTAVTDPKSVKVNLTTGSGLDIEWKDGHVSHYDFVYLRDACPCAMCNEEREKAGRKPGEPAKLAPGMLPMFKAAARPVSAEGIGKYAAFTPGSCCGRFVRVKSANARRRRVELG
jgi:hypothetical protein